MRRRFNQCEKNATWWRQCMCSGLYCMCKVMALQMRRRRRLSSDSFWMARRIKSYKASSEPIFDRIRGRIDDSQGVVFWTPSKYLCTEILYSALIDTLTKVGNDEGIHHHAGVSPTSTSSVHPPNALRWGCQSPDGQKKSDFYSQVVSVARSLG